MKRQILRFLKMPENKAECEAARVNLNFIYIVSKLAQTFSHFLRFRWNERTKFLAPYFILIDGTECKFLFGFTSGDEKREKMLLKKLASIL